MFPGSFAFYNFVVFYVVLMSLACILRCALDVCLIPVEGAGSLGTGVKDGCELPCVQGMEL